MVDNHTFVVDAEGDLAVMAELEGAMGLDLENVDLSLPPEVELILAAKHRQLLRNTAVSIKMQMHLARLRGATDDAKALGKQFDQFVKDIAQLDRLYPGALQKMKVLETAAPPLTA